MELREVLKMRFDSHRDRHPSLHWEAVASALDDKILKSLAYMEETGGEVDVLEGVVEGAVIYGDCSVKTPQGRVSYCYDSTALEARKENKPFSSALGDARLHGLRLFTEKEYLSLQQKVEVDLWTSSWLLTPASIREQGGALFGCKRYGRVFIYHNGAESHYKDRAYQSYVLLKITEEE